MSYIEYKHKIEFGKTEYDLINEYCATKPLDWTMSVWDQPSLEFASRYNLPFLKLPSAKLTDDELLIDSCRTGQLIVVSTGMSKISEIASAVEIIKNENCKFALLHCNSSYPTPIEDANLSTIPYLQKMFDVPIGYSDHTDGIDACIGAVALGANILEKHFTLDKEMDGPDQKLSSDPKEFSELVKKTRLMEKALGKPRDNVTKSEQKFVKRMRKSIGVSKNIPANTKITKSMLTVFRPGNGISPTMIEHIVGLKTKKAINKDTQLSWNMF